MGFSSISAMNTEVLTNGKVWDTFFQKTTGANAFVAGRWYDLSMCTGTPRLNVYPGGMQDATRLWYRSSGSIYSGTPINDGESKHISCAHVWSSVATVTKSLMLLCDYLMFYPLFDADTDAYQDTTTTITLPRYPTGDGVQIVPVITSDLGATPSITMTVTYTNSAGVTGRSTPPVLLGASYVSTTVAHTGVLSGVSCGPFLPLAPGDSGVQSIQGLQLSAGTGSGWICLAMVKPLLSVSVRSAITATERCMLLDIPTMPRVQNEAYLSWFYFAGGATLAASLVGGGLQFKWGNA